MKIYLTICPNPANATASELPAARLAIHAATAACPAYVGNDGGLPDRPVEMSVALLFFREIDKAAPPQVVDLIGNYMPPVMNGSEK